jgi:hypothetical protein
MPTVEFHSVMRFRELSEAEVAEFQRYARENLPGKADWSLFHHVCRQVWWELACKHDGIDPKATFVAFSETNPYFQEA